MKLKITAIGNSAGVILPKELLARLRVDKGDELYVLETPDGIRLTNYDPEFAAKYERQVDAAKLAMARGVQKGNLLAFGSPASAKMAELIEIAFKEVPPDTMKGVRILFIGEAADNPRVQAALSPTGAEYVFVEAK